MGTSPAVHVISLGCAKNLVDTEVMCGALVTEGFCLAEASRDADVLLINTCGFIRDARKESEDAIQRALKWKTRRAGRLVAVAGCLVQRNPQQVAQDYPDIDLLLGLDDLRRLPELLRQAQARQSPAIPTGCLPTFLYNEQTPRMPLTPATFGYIKIAEGCDHRCAYCAIPLIRGRQRSRSVSSVLAECRQLLSLGMRELNLIAQDTSRYGEDLKDGTCLEKLLREIDTLPGEFWVRVLYTHPLHITDGLLDALAHSRHVVPYLDMPLQHIATNVLHRMGRGMDGQATRALLAAIRGKYPNLAFRTTFLVGFPGETSDDFEELLSFVRDFRFDRLGAFAFSPEEGTPAAAMPDQISPRVAARRRNILLATQQEISLENNQRMVGKVMEVLLEEKIRRREWQGRSPFDAPDVDQTVTVTARPGRKAPGFARVTITAASEYGWSATEN
ncbi:MAG: 30S ribosomal protein S12 methylthiotransferase RimO [Victivallales bacterium]|nr:30S ribosomal protein S12 methylthiotransferase RimO [Victivallales bacterium]